MKHFPRLSMRRFRCDLSRHFCEGGISRELTKAVCARYRVDGTNLDAIPLQAEQHAFMQKVHSNPASEILDMVNDVDDI